MQVDALPIPGAYVVTPRQFPDGRGVFLEGFRSDLLAEHIGHPMTVVQDNISVSCRGTVRGVHFADVPPGQAKYITAVAGSLLDFVVDLRVGSPTFGRCESVLLDTASRRAVYVAEGLGHAFCALEDDTTAVYLCSAAYDPPHEHGVNPLDPQIGLTLPEGLTPMLSDKDRAAPSLEEAQAAGLLPTWAQCQDYAEALRRG